MATRKCIRNLAHEWETVHEYRTHTVKQCTRCKVKHWKHRNTGIKRPHHQRTPQRV